MKRTTVTDLGLALARIDRVLEAGERVHQGRWRRQSVAEHVRHAGAHLDACQQLSRVSERPAEQDAEEELAHAACRAVMALDVLLRQQAGL